VLKGLFSRLSGLTTSWGEALKGVFSRTSLDEGFFDELEEVLISGDVGLELASSLVEDLRRRLSSRAFAPEEARLEFVSLLAERLSTPGAGEELRIEGGRPAVVLFLGVNGSGKTTTVAKLARRFSDLGKRVVVAAADTFRAAASDQLKVWASRVGFRVVSQGEGADPAAVVHDAVSSAIARGEDLVLVDTAGRLHTRHNLMEELSKVFRVCSRLLEGEPRESLLVLDAVTGQNGLRQAQTFASRFRVTGVVLTKYDSSAKGGVVVEIGTKLSLPVRYIGVGEGDDDLIPFDPRSFAAALLGVRAS